ncbi:hypothetical protein N7456_009739 [Penicillium angulare]|uniref:Uncharacterized protein n=1 Tax=Penicillium angulare TaxID=116970 RepID=A0A9W9F5A0_9EURO|nr:hypothetical protein N7456_009739 [Penicillium angulare]
MSYGRYIVSSESSKTLGAATGEGVAKKKPNKNTYNAIACSPGVRDGLHIKMTERSNVHESLPHHTVLHVIALVDSGPMASLFLLWAGCRGGLTPDQRVGPDLRMQQ